MDPEPAGVLLVGLVKLPGGLHYVLSAELLEFFGLLHYVFPKKWLRSRGIEATAVALDVGPVSIGLDSENGPLTNLLSS
jgi:hypothetical protein